MTPGLLDQSANPGQAGTRLCEGCHLPLRANAKPSSRRHGGGCRARTTRSRRREVLLDRIDAMAVELAALKEEVLRAFGPT